MCGVIHLSMNGSLKTHFSKGVVDMQRTSVWCKVLPIQSTIPQSKEPFRDHCLYECSGLLLQTNYCSVLIISAAGWKLGLLLLDHANETLLCPSQEALALLNRIIWWEVRNEMEDSWAEDLADSALHTHQATWHSVSALILRFETISHIRFHSHPVRKWVNLQI